mmetsp:Transcript_7176/g.13294  ORF Transcript_7176/g.13294 Transcript_7176/m.13294 type:complete len:261 (-) Transcript_7176:1791-2573(-)
MVFVLRVQLMSSWKPPPSVPERAFVLLGFLVDVARVLGEGVDEVLDVVAEVAEKVVHGKPNALLESRVCCDLDPLERLYESLVFLGDVLAGLFEVLVHTAAPEVLEGRRSVLEHLSEHRAAPLDAVQRLVREVGQRAHGDSLALSRRSAFLVRGSLERNVDGLVRLSAQRARLEQRLGENEALGVDIVARFQVVERVHHEVQPLPELVRELAFRLGFDACVVDLEAFFQLRVHLHCGSGGTFRLELAHVAPAEQKLPAEV